jgi:hypothetical protein
MATNKNTFDNSELQTYLAVRKADDSLPERFTKFRK